MARDHSTPDPTMTRPDGPGGIRLKEDAPVLLRLQVEARARPETVWAVLSEVRRWPLWHRGADFADLRGELEPGTELRWRMDGMRIRSSLREVEPPTLLGWTMGTLGARGYQRWTLRPSASGTEVTLEEAWGGLFAFFLRRALRRTLVRARTHWLAALRQEVEAREIEAREIEAQEIEAREVEAQEVEVPEVDGR